MRTFLITILMVVQVDAQPLYPPWGPPAYIVGRLRTWQHPPHYGGYPGYRFYDAPLNEGLAPRWSDPRAHWPRDYRYRRECWFRTEC